ncbi:MAG: UDP-glucose 4-epimerase GalE [Desulfobacterales bacterium]
MDILVTGGAGYIGSHCCKELHRRGHTPITLDNLVYGHRENVKWGPFYEGSINDRQVLAEIFTHHRIQAAMHFAAFAYVGESVTDPKKYYQNNLKGTISLLDALMTNGVKHFIFSSSCATYGIPDRIPIDENHPQQPISPYGKSKFMVEEILKDYSTAYPFDFMSLRYFNAAGADPEGETGEKHDPETHLIPLVLDVAKGRSKSIKVFGTNYDTEDGSCVRDYIHVTDLSDAHVLALEKLLEGHRSEFINLGTGKGYSVLKVIEIASKVTGIDISYEVTDRRPGDPAILIAANDKARRVLGWSPRFPDLDTIVSSAWKWHRKLK